MPGIPLTQTARKTLAELSQPLHVGRRPRTAVLRKPTIPAGNHWFLSWDQAFVKQRATSPQEGLAEHDGATTQLLGNTNLRWTFKHQHVEWPFWRVDWNALPHEKAGKENSLLNQRNHLTPWAPLCAEKCSDNELFYPGGKEYSTHSGFSLTLRGVKQNNNNTMGMILAKQGSRKCTIVTILHTAELSQCFHVGRRPRLLSWGTGAL